MSDNPTLLHRFVWSDPVSGKRGKLADKCTTPLKIISPYCQHSSGIYSLTCLSINFVPGWVYKQPSLCSEISSHHQVAGEWNSTVPIFLFLWLCPCWYANASDRSNAVGVLSELYPRQTFFHRLVSGDWFWKGRRGLVKGTGWPRGSKT